MYSLIRGMIRSYRAMMRDITSISGGNALDPIQEQLITMQVKTFRQRSCNQRVGFLLCGVVRIYEGGSS